MFIRLVPEYMCTTPIQLVIEGEGLTEDGSPVEVKILDIKCNYQDGGRAIFGQQKKAVEIKGTALFDGDICPSIPNIVTGKATINGITRPIVEGIKHRNPDGSVNYTEVRLG